MATWTLEARLNLVNALSGEVLAVSAECRQHPELSHRVYFSLQPFGRAIVVRHRQRDQAAVSIPGSVQIHAELIVNPHDLRFAGRIRLDYSVSSHLPITSDTDKLDTQARHAVYLLCRIMFLMRHSKE